MERIRLPWLLVICALSVGAIADERLSTSKLGVLRTSVEGFNLDMPEEDLERRLNHGDYRLIGVLGYTLSIPGTDMDQFSPTVKQLGVHIVDGTSDALEGEEHGKLVREVRQYAKQYNQALLSRLGIDE
jgi:hypothetical protein